MKCTANIDESEVGKIRPGQAARLTFDAYPGEPFLGKVIQVRLQPITVQNVVSYGTVIEVPNPDYKLKPGMTATVSVEINRKSNVLRVPATAVRFRPTEEIFAALNQPMPPEMQPRGGQRGAGGNGGTRMAGGLPGGSGAPAGPGAGGGPGAPAAQNAQSQPRGDGARAVERGGGDRPQGSEPGFNRQGGGQGRGPGQGTPGEGNRQFAGGQRREGGFGGGQGGFGGGQRGEGGMGGRRPFDPNDPEARARLIETYQSLPADQQAQRAARLKERGIDIEAMIKGAKPGAGARSGAAQPEASSPLLQHGTIDALFGPLPVRATRGSAWLWLANQKQMKSVNLRLGITDGQWFELLEGDLQPGTELVTAVTLGTESANRLGAAPGGNPLMQRPGMMGGPGGFPGGGGGGGRGR
jgi:hypothetical protein